MEPGLRVRVGFGCGAWTFVSVRVRKSTLILTINAEENWKDHALDLNYKFIGPHR